MDGVHRRVIDRFVGKHAFLSNFYSSTIYVDAKAYATVEHAYQAHKSLDESVKETIRNAPTAAVAKKLGRAVILRSDWEDVKVDLMKSFIKKKFENPFLRPLLLQTDDATLIEGNHWNDTFWGVCRGKGLNVLGRILEEERRMILLEEELEADEGDGRAE